MTEHEFNEWFLKSFDTLVVAVFRCMGGRTRQDAEDAIQDVFLGMIKKWEIYGKRMYTDKTGKVRMRRKDGNPGATLYAYMTVSACRRGRLQLQIQAQQEEAWMAWIQARQGKGLSHSPPNPLAEIDVLTAFRDCWESLLLGEREAIRKRRCPHEKKETLDNTERTRLHRGLLKLYTCLVSHGCRYADLIDVRWDMLDFICDGWKSS